MANYKIEQNYAVFLNYSNINYRTENKLKNTFYLFSSFLFIYKEISKIGIKNEFK